MPADPRKTSKLNLARRTPSRRAEQKQKRCTRCARCPRAAPRVCAQRARSVGRRGGIVRARVHRVGPARARASGEKPSVREPRARDLQAAERAQSAQSLRALRGEFEGDCAAFSSPPRAARPRRAGLWERKAASSRLPEAEPQSTAESARRRAVCARVCAQGRHVPQARAHGRVERGAPQSR